MPDPTPGRGARAAWLSSRVTRPPVLAWLTATLLSGLPSTLHALARRTDPWAPTRAAGAMLIGPVATLPRHVAAAALVHGTISAFWTTMLVVTLPRRRALPAAILASAAIGVLDLKVIAPRAFPDVARLPFWPQMADHLMWGACVGAVLALHERGVRHG